MKRALVSITHIKSMAMAQVVLESGVSVGLASWLGGTGEIPSRFVYDSSQLQLEKPCLVKSNFTGLSFGWD